MTEKIGVNEKHQDPISLFLTGLELLIDKKESWQQLNELWSDYSSRPSGPDSFQCYSSLIKKCSIRSQRESLASNVVPFVSNKEKECSGIISGFINDFCGLEKELKKRYSEKYSWFRPTWEHGEILWATYPDEINPGIIIGEFLPLLFPENLPSENYSAVHEVEVGSQLHELLVKSGYICIEWSEYPPETKKILKVALDNILFQQTLTDSSDLTFETLLETVLMAPADFFTAWAREWWLLYEDDKNFAPSISSSSLKILFSRAAIWLAGSSNRSRKKPLLSPTMLWDLFYKIREDGSLEYDAELEILLAEFFSEYSRIRKTKYFGASLMSLAVSSDIACELESSGYNMELFDFTILLSSGDRCYGDINFEQGEGKNAVVEFTKKEKVYITLFHQAVGEGLPELGNALLSLYLLARSLRCNGRFNFAGSLHSAIASGLCLPGAPILVSTLEALTKWSEEILADDAAAKLSGRFFKQFVPKKATLHLLHGEKDDTRKIGSSEEQQAQLVYRTQLGEERWGKLSTSSKRYLVTAEILWKKSAPEFGFGIGDWSPLIINYCKVLEKELVDRLAPFFSSPEFKENFFKRTNRQPDSKPTVGFLVRELQRYDEFSCELKMIIDATRTTLHSDKKLLSEIQKITDLRNQSAHKDEFNMVKFAQFRQMYFDDKIIHRFIDAMG